MKAFILAAGMGTRLKPWTLSHPKALVPVGGVPMLERVINRLVDEGFDDITVNVHHFAGQIVDFLENHDFGININVSDESEQLLDTGGALVAAASFLCKDNEPFLVHNVDILSDAPLAHIMKCHKESDRDISLLTSSRNSSRKLIFDKDGILHAWHNLSTGEIKPSGYCPVDGHDEHAFSGIYVVNSHVVNNLAQYGASLKSCRFPIMDYFLDNPMRNRIGEIYQPDLNLIDIGKPDTLSQAEQLFADKA